MEDFLYLDIPAFRVLYKRRKRYGYLKMDEKENTKEALTKASSGHCMYCYSRVKVDNKLYGHLEHAIEKNNSEKLTECIPDIGLTCSVCNLSFKRIGEQKRKLIDTVRKNFEEKSRCWKEQRKQCTVPCHALRTLQKEYSKMPDAEIILQPMGVVGEQSGEPLAVQYDIMRMEFQPNTNLYTYSAEELIFIHRHIQRFHLNDPKYRTRQLAYYIKDVIDKGGILPDREYNNMIVQLFAQKIESKTEKERVDICSKIYTVMFLRI
jgi:5-methylcytosine-specific restriction endonuclease McrA